MTLDPLLLREAQDVLCLYASPAQELIKQNLYGPREARFAGAIVKHNFTVIEHEQATETEALKALRTDAWKQIKKLSELLAKTTQIIEERLAGGYATLALLAECETQIATAEEDFEVEIEEKP